MVLLGERLLGVVSVVMVHNLVLAHLMAHIRIALHIVVHLVRSLRDSVHRSGSGPDRICIRCSCDHRNSVVGRVSCFATSQDLPYFIFIYWFALIVVFKFIF